MGAQLRGVQTPRAEAVEEPLPPEERTPVQGRPVRLDVLVGDLLPGPDVHVGQDGHVVVGGGVNDGFGVAGAGVVHHAVDRVEADPLHRLAGPLQCGGVGGQHPGRPPDLNLSEPAGQAESLLQLPHHELRLELPELGVLRLPLLVVVHHLPEQAAPLPALALHQEEQSEDGDSRVDLGSLVPPANLLHQAGPVKVRDEVRGQLSYAIKTQLKAPKAPRNASLWYKRAGVVAWTGRVFPGELCTRPSESQPGSSESGRGGDHRPGTQPPPPA